MKVCLIVVLCFVAVAQGEGQCNFVPVVVEEGLSEIKNVFDDVKIKNVDPFIAVLANTKGPLAEFNEKLKDLVKEYMNQSCVMESINAIDTSVKNGLKVVEQWKPSVINKLTDESFSDYNKVIADEIMKQTASLEAYVKVHNINLTCYLEVFREGFRNVTHLFDNVIPDYMNTFAEDIKAKLVGTTQKMDFWTGTIATGVEDCKSKPFTPFCIAALLQEKTPKLVKETDVGGLLLDTKITYANGLEGEMMNAIQIISMAFQKIFNALMKC